MVSETVEAEGHLIDSGNFQSILTTDRRARLRVRNPSLRRRPHQRTRFTPHAEADMPTTDARLQDLLSKLSVFGCFVKGTPDALLRPADMDGAAPVDFYSTTNHRTSVYLNGAWVPVDNQRMDAALVVDSELQNLKTSADLRTSGLLQEAARYPQGRSGRLRHAGRSRRRPTCSRATSRASAS